MSPYNTNIQRIKIGNEIIDERFRVIADEGYTTAHDDTHKHGELARAAAVYAMFAGLPDLDRQHAQKFGPALYGSNVLWPWDLAYFKLTNPRRDLIKAAALIMAEIERLDRVHAAEMRGGLE